MSVGVVVALVVLAVVGIATACVIGAWWWEERRDRSLERDLDL